ncbi:MAG: porin [Gammaproteobacteria bacterium]|nr:porin [Gammaproteobacteria bacterium]
MKPLKINLILLALASTLVAQTATAENSVYGKGHVSVASIEDANGKASAISSHSSRFGVKGNLSQEGSTQVFYKIEWQVDISDVSKDSSSTSIDLTAPGSAETKTSHHFKSRNQYIGLKDSWGELRLGRDDSPYKKAGKKAVEFFSDTYADYNSIVDKGQDVRADSSMSYSVKLGSGKISLMRATGNDTTTAANAGDMTSFAYDAKFGALTLGLATQKKYLADTNYETGTKLVLGFKLAKATKLGLLHETVSDDLTLDDNNTLISIKHNIGRDAVKLVYGSKSHVSAEDDTMTALAYDHKLTKAATVYALYASSTNDGLKDSGGLSGDATVIAGGLVVTF